MVRILLIITLMFSAHLESKPLTLETCFAIANDKNPLKRIAQEGYCAAAAAVGVAKAPYYPEMQAVGSYHRFQQHIFLPSSLTLTGVPTIVGPEDDWNFFLGSSYLLYDWGRRSAQLASMRALRAKACFEVRQATQDVIKEVALSFYQVLASESFIEVAEKNLARARNTLSMSEQRFKVGDVPKADVLRTRVGVANAKQEQVAAQSQLRLAKGNLNVSMGLPPYLGIELESEEKEIKLPNEEELTKAFLNAGEKRPEIHAAQQDLQSIFHQVQVARSDYGPRVFADAAYGRRDSVYYPKDQEWRMGVTVEVPLFTGFKTTYQLEQTKREYCRAVAQYEQLWLNVQQEVWTSYSRLVEAFERVQTSEAEVEDARESMRLSDKRYAAGAATTTDLLVTQAALARAEATYVKAYWNYHRAYVEFLWTQGMLWNQ